MNKDDINKAIRETYAAIAAESEQWYPYCFASHNAFGPVGETLAMGYSSEDLQSIPHESIMGLGCANPISIANIMPGDAVLDIGSGGGIDCFLASNRVTNKGKVVGIDMTSEMVSKSRITAAHYGYSNIEFRTGDMGKLSLPDNTIDIIISNCAVNLSWDKFTVFKEAFRVLKPGGSVFISDTAKKNGFANDLSHDIDAWVQCVGGAISRSLYLSTLDEVGFIRNEIVSENVFLNEFESSENTCSILVQAFKPL